MSTKNNNINNYAFIPNSNDLTDGIVSDNDSAPHFTSK
jgi:hypothetical protein